MVVHQLFLLMFFQLVSSYPFTEDNWNSFDAYGEKVAANNLVIVQARNKDAQFLVQFGPFNTSNYSSPCYIDYAGVSTGKNNFIYNVVVPHRTYGEDDTSIIFVGENGDNSTLSNPFVGHLQVNSSCEFSYNMHSFVEWGHDEFYVVDVDPYGNVAFGFSSQFAFSYDLQSNTTNYLQGWPISNFTPRAVDVNSAHYGVMAGFVEKAQYTYKPYIYLLKLDMNSSSIIGTYEYVPTNGSWQSTTSNSDAANFTQKHTMSVAFHDNTSQALVGMPSMNIIFWFNITMRFSLIGTRTNGYQRGYGKSVGWNEEVGGPYPVVLGNSYSFPYVWSSSIVYWFFAWQFSSSNPVMPLFPTAQFPRWIELGQELVTIAVTSFNVVILDSVGQMYVMLSTPEGSLPGTNEATGFNPAFSSTNLCQAGMYKNWIGLDICSPCLMGTMTETEGSIECLPYDCNSTHFFCPICSVTNDTYSDIIIAVSQARAYPTSPETTAFDDILIQNMFTFGNSAHCLVVSPMFWMVLMIGIAGLILIIMGLLKFVHRWAKFRLIMKRIFQQIDLIKEGEVWVGGLASFSLIILLGFAYSFSYSYLQQYPIETSSESTFACDASLRNAKFSTSLQSLSTPHTDEEEPIFDLLNEQQFTLTIDFINTQFICDSVKVTQIIHSVSKTVTSSCKYNRSMLSVSVVLGSHAATLNYNFDGVLPIGGLRVSLWGKQQETSNSTTNVDYLVQELNYIQPFYVNNQTLASDPTIEMSLTRVINHTAPLSDNGQQVYNAIWIPSIASNVQNLFLTLDEFLYYGLLQPSLSISISETTYFIENIQEPIAKQAETIFHDLLFTIVCLELFGLVFLIVKLIFLPFFNLVRHFIEKRANLVHPQRLHRVSEFVVNHIKEKQPDISFIKQHKEPFHRSKDKKGTAWITTKDGK